MAPTSIFLNILSSMNGIGSGQQQQGQIGFGCVPGGQEGPEPNSPAPNFLLDDTDIRIENFIFNYL